MKLTAAQTRYLATLVYADGRMVGRGSERTVAVLARLGLVEVRGEDPQYPQWTKAYITDAGRAALEEA